MSSFKYKIGDKVIVAGSSIGPHVQGHQGIITYVDKDDDDYGAPYFVDNLSYWLEPGQLTCAVTIDINKLYKDN